MARPQDTEHQGFRREISFSAPVVRQACEGNSLGAGQLCVVKQIADDVCGKHSAFGVIAGQELHRAEPVIFVLPAFERLFHLPRLPRAIRSDNGVPFASPLGLFQLSKLSV